MTLRCGHIALAVPFAGPGPRREASREAERRHSRVRASGREPFRTGAARFRSPSVRPRWTAWAPSDPTGWRGPVAALAYLLRYLRRERDGSTAREDTHRARIDPVVDLPARHLPERAGRGDRCAGMGPAPQRRQLPDVGQHIKQDIKRDIGQDVGRDARQDSSACRPRSGRRPAGTAADSSLAHVLAAVTEKTIARSSWPQRQGWRRAVPLPGGGACRAGRTR